MQLVKSLLVAKYILYISGLVKAGCKSKDFNVSFKNKALKGHVFKTEWTPNDRPDCEHKCFADDRCIAYNYGLAANGRKDMCELSDSDHVMHPSDLVERDGTIYRRAKNKCDCRPFKVCRVNFEDDTHRCECKPRFTGSQCEIAIKPCDSSPCQNGGTCVDNLASFTLTCTCASGYTGQFCETQITACDSKPCLNGGTCIPKPGDGYSCTCTTNMIGESCEYMKGSSSMSWANALDDCKRKGGNLLSIHNAAENLEISQFFSQLNMWFWIGVHKNSTGQYSWSDGTALNYTNWFDGHPYLDCTYMHHTGVWVTNTCNNQYKYICLLK